MAKTDWTARTAAIEYFTKAARRSWGDSEMRDLYEAAVHALRRSQDHTALQTRCNEFAAEVDALRATVARQREALEKALDTFDDFARYFDMMNKPTLAAACDIAQCGCRAALAAAIRARAND